MKAVRIISSSFALFAMLFGAANVVYPLNLGRSVGSMIWFALAGFFVTAVIVPFIGFISAILFEGKYKDFFKRIGKTPGFLLILFSLMLIGPFAIAPRCITISYASIKIYLPASISLFIFSIFAGFIILLATIRPGKVLDLLGKVLGPIKLTLLLSMIVKGLLKPTDYAISSFTPTQSFTLGLTEGYWTLDLLATIFFSGLLLSGLSKKEDRTEENYKERLRDGLISGALGLAFLALVYTGFCVVSAMHSAQLPPVDKADLLSSLCIYILGPVGGLFANIVMCIACLTTAIALTSLFTDYLRRELLAKKVKYLPCLLITIAITMLITSLGFSAIEKMLLPIVCIAYPAILTLAVLNIAYKIWGFSYVKLPFFIALGASIANYFELFSKLF